MCLILKKMLFKYILYILKNAKMFFLNLKLSLINLKLTMINLKLSLINLKLTLINLKLTLINLKLTLINLKLSLINLKLTLINLKLSLINLKLTLINLNVTLINLNLSLINLRVKRCSNVKSLVCDTANEHALTCTRETCSCCQTSVQWNKWQWSIYTYSNGREHYSDSWLPHEWMHTWVLLVTQRS